MSAMQVKESARGRWHGILESLGIEPRFLRKNHGPCPICGGKDRYRFDDKQGDGTYYCNAHGAGDGFRLLMEFHGWDFKTAKEEVMRVAHIAPHIEPRPQRTPEDAKAALNRIYKECTKVKATDPVGRYFAARGITAIPDVLYHHALKYVEGETVTTFPAMVALVRNAEGKPIALHRTYLKDGNKAPVSSPKKVMKGAEPMTGCLYIRLFQSLPEMGIAEGIETACAAHQLFSVPVWSVLDASHMEQFIPPDGVKLLHIFADNDRTYTGQRAAYILANKLAINSGMAVKVHVPPVAGADYADLVKYPDALSLVQEIEATFQTTPTMEIHR